MKNTIKYFSVKLNIVTKRVINHWISMDRHEAISKAVPMPGEYLLVGTEQS